MLCAERRSNIYEFYSLGFTQPAFKPTIHRTRGEYANHYTIDVIYLLGYEHEIKDTSVVYI